MKGSFVALTIKYSFHCNFGGFFCKLFLNVLENGGLTITKH